MRQPNFSSPGITLWTSELYDAFILSSILVELEPKKMTNIEKATRSYPRREKRMNDDPEWKKGRKGQLDLANGLKLRQLSN